MDKRMYAKRASLGKHGVERPSAKSRARRGGWPVGIVAVALAGLLAAGGTVAWLADETESVTNTFVPGQVTTGITEGFDGANKSDVHVVNTSNVPVYVRAQVVVNWVDEAGNVYGKAPVAGKDYTISYNEETQPGYGGKWTKGVDGFWYWSGRVAPNAATGFLIASCTPMSPSTAPGGYHLSVEILSQAIQADGTTSDGTPAVADAWTNDEVTVTVGADGTLSVAAKSPQGQDE